MQSGHGKAGPSKWQRGAPAVPDEAFVQAHGRRALAGQVAAWLSGLVETANGAAAPRRAP